MDIEDDAILYMEDLLYHLLALICSAQPHSINDVTAYITKNFVAPINTWAINDAQKTMERHQLRKGKSVFKFPVEKLHLVVEKVNRVKLQICKNVSWPQFFVIEKQSVMKLDTPKNYFLYIYAM